MLQPNVSTEKPLDVSTVICVVELLLESVDLLDDLACAYVTATRDLVSASGLFRGFRTEEEAMDYSQNYDMDGCKSVLAGRLAVAHECKNYIMVG